MTIEIKCEFADLQTLMDRLSNAEGDARMAAARCEAMQEKLDQLASPVQGLSNSDLRYQVEYLLRSATTGGKIGCIKAVRHMLRDDRGVSFGLKEAKDFVELHWGKAHQY